MHENIVVLKYWKSFTFSRNVLNAIQSGWLFIALGFLLMYGPTYWDMANTIWQNGEQTHGPIVLIITIWLIWQAIDRNSRIFRHSSMSGSIAQMISLIAVIIFALGWLNYVVGRSQGILVLEVGSQILVLSGIALLQFGFPGLKAISFPLFFCIFMIPMPAFFLDMITLPMKIAVSNVAEYVLYAIGFPIARSGVILQIGVYQLEVANVCAGMHTLISLEALGLLYLKLVSHNSAFRNIALAILIVPISFSANTIRVIAITLVTYYFGDEVGQGFVHGFAGMLLFVVALGLIMLVDTLLQSLVKDMQPDKVIGN